MAVKPLLDRYTMQPEAKPNDVPTHQQQHMEASVEALSARIAGLAMALGLSLLNEADVTRVMRSQRVTAGEVERRVGLERRAASRTDTNSDRRVAHSWEELRGLIVMRYDVERRCAEIIGGAATRELLIKTEEGLVRRGFKPGAAGIDIKRLFGNS